MLVRACAVHAPRLLARRCSTSAAAAEHRALSAELARIQSRIFELEVAHPETRSAHCVGDAFAAPKLHHINIVSARGSQELLTFYRDIMKMDEMPIELFPRTAADAEGGSNVPINFTTDNHLQLHLSLIHI